MIVTINTRVVADLPRERDMWLEAETASVMGRVHTQMTAQRAANKDASLRAIAVFFAFGLGGAFLLYAAGGAGGALAAAGLVFLLAAPFAAYFSASLAQQRWRNAQREAADLPPPGTAISADGSGLTVGARQFSWSALDVARVDLQRIGSDNGNNYVLMRMVLTGVDFKLLIDPLRIENGRALLNKAYRHLVRARRPPAASLLSKLGF